MRDYIYMDNAATTPIKEEVLEEMMPFLKDRYGNPSSVYSLAQSSKSAVEKAREQVANQIGAKRRNIFYSWWV